MKAIGIILAGGNNSRIQELSNKRSPGIGADKQHHTKKQNFENFKFFKCFCMENALY